LEGAAQKKMNERLFKYNVRSFLSSEILAHIKFEGTRSEADERPEIRNPQKALCRCEGDTLFLSQAIF
jgi:hypothetical protein